MPHPPDDNLLPDTLTPKSTHPAPTTAQAHPSRLTTQADTNSLPHSPPPASPLPYYFKPTTADHRHTGPSPLTPHTKPHSVSHPFSDNSLPLRIQVNAKISLHNLILSRLLFSPTLELISHPPEHSNNEDFSSFLPTPITPVVKFMSGPLTTKPSNYQYSHPPKALPPTHDGNDIRSMQTTSSAPEPTTKPKTSAYLASQKLTYN
ncbi:mucin-2-like [Penaeus chinensis]|uniref:mucin-2-like n=1 Tax=Penaeus chinensis TaxID=139456 RepID=UPI001FB62619|nr:mucin-2-like [Penaeus chinensis]